MEQSRAKKAIYNMSMSLAYSVLTLVTAFFVRKLFLSSFGVTILGYNSTFSSILGMLNLAELGVGMAITYKLYEPVARRDYDVIAAYVDIYKKVYSRIGFFILVAGVAIVPFLPVIVKESYDKWLFLGSIFILQILSTVATYWFSYKRMVFNVYQDNYIASIVDGSVHLIITILQVICLCLFKDYYVYLGLLVIKVILSNILLSFICDRKYTQLRLNRKDRSCQISLDSLRTDISNVLIAKLGAYVLNSTDALIISCIMGAVATGYMTNYTTVFGSFQSMILVMLVTIQPSLGNKIACEKNRYEVEKIILKCTYLTQLITSIFCIPAFFMMKHFISLWLSKKYILDDVITFMFALNVYLSIMSNPISLLFGALGYYKYDKFVIGAAATLNIILSVMLVLHWGLVGVLFGTTVSWLLYWCSRVIILYKKYYQFSAAKYIKRIIRCVIATILAAGLVFVFDLKLSCMGTSVSLFIVKGILYVILVLIIDVLTFWGTEELQYGGLLLNKVIKR